MTSCSSGVKSFFIRYYYVTACSYSCSCETINELWTAPDKVEALNRIILVIFGRLFKKGTSQTATNDSIVVLNEDKVAYPVDKADAAVWNQCSGITFEQLRDAISSRLGWQIPPDVLSHLKRFINWCIWAKLIEVRDFIPDQFAQLMQQNRTE